VSQYYDTVYFDFLVKNKASTASWYGINSVLTPEQDHIQQRIQNYFEATICPLIALENYVIDFVVYDNYNDNDSRIIVIELNPWAKTTGMLKTSRIRS